MTIRTGRVRTFHSNVFSIHFVVSRLLFAQFTSGDADSTKLPEEPYPLSTDLGVHMKAGYHLLLELEELMKRIKARWTNAVFSLGRNPGVEVSGTSTVRMEIHVL